MLYDYKPGKVSFLLGGQFGSEGKGAAAAWLAKSLLECGKGFDVVTTNAGSQSGHTSIHDGVTRVAFHLPTAPFIDDRSLVYLNAGAIIDPDLLLKELSEFSPPGGFFIHPNAAVITQECKDAEGRDDSAQTKISSTRKGVGEALSRKVLRSGMIAKDCPALQPFIRRLDLNVMLSEGDSVLAEVPQGYGLSLNGPFHPYCTSRDCTIMQAMNDAGIHPSFMGQTMLVLRSFPIRVGSLPGSSSGDCYSDQKELTWEKLGVKAEITTVTKRIRRVFSWSWIQLREALAATQPGAIFLTHCDYMRSEPEAIGLINGIKVEASKIGLDPVIVTSNGPTTADAKVWEG